MSQITPIPLDFPVTTATGQTLTSITMRRAKVKDLRRMPDFGTTDADQEIGLMAFLAGIPVEDFDLIDAADYRKLQDSFRGLLSPAKAAAVAGNGAAGEVVPVSAG